MVVSKIVLKSSNVPSSNVNGLLSEWKKNNMSSGYFKNLTELAIPMKEPTCRKGFGEPVLLIFENRDQSVWEPHYNRRFSSGVW
jgi:hypothetical protein